MVAKLASAVISVEMELSGVICIGCTTQSLRNQWEQIVVLRIAAKKISKDLGNWLEKSRGSLYPEHPPFLYYFHFYLQPQALILQLVFSYFENVLLN